MREHLISRFFDHEEEEGEKFKKILMNKREN